jgi:3-hydroxybutyryl-CoA dehydrogenase
MTAIVSIIGAGTMGHGIAYAALAAGYAVALTDADAATLARGAERIGALFDKGVERGKVTAEAREAGLARLRAAASVADAVRDAEIVVEAVPERLDLKRALFAETERHAPAGALLGSNTSSLSITAIAEGLAAPERVVGLHFFNPVPAMRLLEIVRGARTSDETVARARALAERLGKTPIVVRDTPGFATSRLGVVLGLEAARMVEQGVATPEDIDRAMELGYNHPMGPLRLGDLVGLDVRLAIADHLHAVYGDDTYRAPDLLRRMVADGRLGRKTGRGFYDWNETA